MKIFLLFFLLFHLSIFASQTTKKFDLGMEYLLGEGVQQDKQKAFKYLDEAAQDGNVEAIYNLALMYYIGDGVAQNIPMAAKLLDRVARNGYKSAIQNVGRIYMQIFKFDKALYWLKINAKNGDIKANYLLAEIYVQKEDFKKAKLYARQAIKSDDKDAKLLWKDYKLFNY